MANDQLFDPSARLERPENIGGPRTYAGAEANQRAPWKCPACGEEQVGALSEGCASCGSGVGAAKHVGVDPIVTAEERARRAQEVAVAQGGGIGMRPTPSGAAFVPELAAARTIYAAMLYFVDRVLQESTEEIISGEWQSVAEFQAVITRYKETYGL